MSCLNTAQIQAVVDGEAGSDVRAHVASCARCAERVRDRELTIAALVSSVNSDAGIPHHLRRRIDAALASEQPSGATRLRAGAAGSRPRHRAFWSAALAAAATIVAILFIAPLIKEPHTVSASEILAESANRLAKSATSGVEVLEYELVIDGVPREMMPDHENGTYKVWQAIDHGTPGRFRYATFGPDGQPISSIAQDPRTGRRVMMMAIDGQAYRFEVSLPEAAAISLLEIERLHMEATITMMQASGNQLLEVVDTPQGRQYRIEVQHVGANTTANPVWDLTQARVLIRAEDYRVTEFAVTGTFLKRPYSVSYKLLSRTLGANLQAGVFDVPTLPGQIELSGEGSAMPARDVMMLAFRELARLKQAR